MRLNLQLCSKIPKNYHFSNFPQRFIEKHTEFVEWKTPAQPNYQPKVIRYRNRAYYDINPPWTNEFANQNTPTSNTPKIYVEPIRKWHFFVGDVVQILTGKDQGKQSIVNYVVRERNWVCAKGLNLGYKLEQRSRSYPGNLNAFEKPLLVPRDVSLVDPEDNQPTTIEWRYDEEGEEIRVSLRSGRVIPIPKKAFETRDFVSPRVYKEQPKDTMPDVVTKITFVPQLKTFEMEISDDFGIKEDRVPYPTYWY